MVILIVLAIILILFNLPTFKSSHEHVKNSTVSTTDSTIEPQRFGVGWMQFQFQLTINNQIQTILINLSYPVANKQNTSVNAAPDYAYAPYPMIVFSQGFGISWQSYEILMNYMTSHGYVVAYIIYPYTDPNLAPELVRADIVNHPFELNSAVSYLLELNASADSIKGLINPTEIGLAGQSDGGDVSLAVAVDSVYKNPIFKAVALYSAAEYDVFSGSYFTASQPPLLITQGTTDDINPPYCSIQIYNEASPPKYYVELIGADHLTPYTTSSIYEKVVARVSLAFFNKYLKNEPNRHHLSYYANLPNVSSLINSPSIVPTNYDCPGAP